MYRRHPVMIGVVMSLLWAGLAWAQFEPPPVVPIPPQPVGDVWTVCWRLGDFPLDFVQLNVTELTPIGSQVMLGLSGLWRNGGAGYQLLGAGHATQALDNQSVQLGVSFENGTSSFGGQPICRFSANVPFAPPFNGTWSFACSGGFPSSSPVRALVQVTCVEEPTPVSSALMRAMGIKAAGDPE